jgi:hypothetical protein
MKTELITATIFLFIASTYFLAIGVMRADQTGQIVLALGCTTSFAWGVLSTAEHKRFGWLSNSEKEWAGMQSHSKSWLVGIGLAVFLLFALDRAASNYFSVLYLCITGALLSFFWLGRFSYWLRIHR